MRLVVAELAASSAVQALDFDVPPTLLTSSVPLPRLALFGHGAISELSLLSGVKRKLDFRARQGQLLARSGRSPIALRASAARNA
jgi:hypothetical protein